MAQEVQILMLHGFANDKHELSALFKDYIGRAMKQIVTIPVGNRCECPYATWSYDHAPG